MTFKELRIRQGLTLREASKKIGISFQSICRYENQGRIPRGDILQMMVDVYKCTDEEMGQAIMNNIQKRRKEV